MSATFLTREEVKELTGAHSRQRQIDTLRLQRVPFFVNAAGWPVVTRSVLSGDRAAPQAAGGWAPRVLRTA